MQAGTTTKPLLLVVIGLPGAGKSFFARRFAETFNAPLVSYDEIRYELFNDISYSDNESAVVARIANLQLRELFHTRKIIIVDGGYNLKSQRTELAKNAKKAGYVPLCIWVQTDQKTVRERSLKRSSKRDDDQFNRSLTEDEFTLQQKKFTPPSQHESFIVISGRHTYATQAKIVLKNMVTAPHETNTISTENTKPVDKDRRRISL